MKIRKGLKVGLALFCAVFVVVSGFIIISNRVVNDAAQGKTFSNLEQVPKHRVGLILGTSKYYKGGGLNFYFKYRLNAVEALFKAGKIEFILVSGDNSTMSYNEPMTIKRELIKRGIPEVVIFLDYAGFRTLDSVIRAKEIFGLDRVMFISQKFHNERAIYIAEKHGINAVGFNAHDVEGIKGIRIQLREYFARAKAFLDILFDVEPKFYGEKIEIKLPEQFIPNDSLPK